MATASIILLNRNAPLEGSNIYTSVYVYIILKISVISSTWWPHRRFAFCQRRHFLQCQMGSRREPLNLAATSALHIHPRASLILALRPHTLSLKRTQTENAHLPTCTDVCTCTLRIDHTYKHLLWLRKCKKTVYLLCQDWKGTGVSDLQANSS